MTLGVLAPYRGYKVGMCIVLRGSFNMCILKPSYMRTLYFGQYLAVDLIFQTEKYPV